MKKDIHPQYEEATVHCSCGNMFTTRSTKKELHVELCSQCHPFYTGKQKLVDSGGRVDRFKRRMQKRAEPVAVAAPKPAPAKAAPVKAKAAKPAAVKPKPAAADTAEPVAVEPEVAESEAAKPETAEA